MWTVKQFWKKKWKKHQVASPKPVSKVTWTLKKEKRHGSEGGGGGANNGNGTETGKLRSSEDRNKLIRMIAIPWPKYSDAFKKDNSSFEGGNLIVGNEFYRSSNVYDV